MTSEHPRILYAEDDQDACFMLAAVLRLSNIEVTCVGTVAEASHLAQTEHFDLYLLDSRFTDGNGLELCRALREYAPHTPIIFYSGDARKIDIQKGLEAGADAYLVKPYFDDLTRTILKTIQPLRVAA